MKRCDMAVCIEYHRNRYDLQTFSPELILTTSRPHMARVHRHRSPSLLHHLFRYRSQRRNRRHLPRTVSRACPRIMGVLGVLHRHRITRDSCCLLVRDPEYEWGQRCQMHDCRYLAIFLDVAQRYSGVTGHRDQHDGQLFHLLAYIGAVSLHASE
jgi:hypothetical protein